MELNEYQNAAEKFAVYPQHGTGSWTAVAYVSLGAAGEAGEVANKVKKVARDDNLEMLDSRREAILDEVGGCLWYLSQICTELGTNLSFVAQANLAELGRRQENGTIWGDGDKR